MERSPRNVTIVLLLCTLFFSFQILYAGLWVSYQAITCDAFFETNLLTFALLLILVSVIGVVGAWRKWPSLLWLYVHCKFVLILVLFVSLFGFYVTSKGWVPQDFLRRRVEDERNWEIVKSWLQARDVCMTDCSDTRQGRCQMERFSVIRSGCCNPYHFDEAALTPNVMCFDCPSCRGAFLDAMRSDLEKVSAVCSVYLVCIIIVYSIICCIPGSSSGDSYLKRKN